MEYDLLVEPVLSYRCRGRRTLKATLPGMLSLVASGELTEFPRLRTHQFQPWCMFLAQLAALALHRGGHSDPRVGEEEWRGLLLELTDREHEPWSLLIEDLARPAFFQSPVPEGTMEGWRAYRCPDDADLLVTSKGLDVKAHLIAPDDVEAWVYALVTLQTMQGFLGQGNYGISRMNGGFGNRPFVALVPDMTIAGGFRRNVDVLLSTWSGLIGKHGFAEKGVALLWTVAWDGQGSLAKNELSPHFIEVCRRLRLERAGPRGPFRCRRATSRAPRSLREVGSGDVGDPWIPVRIDKATALTVGPRGFDYQLVTDLLFEGTYSPAAASELRPGDADSVVFSAWALARGQGTTDGLRERTLALLGTARMRLARQDERAAVGRRANGWIGRAEKMRGKVLFPALKRIALGGTVPKDDFSTRVDEVFFDQLFGRVEAGDADANLAFERTLYDLAEQELHKAIERCVVPDAQRLRAISEAEGLFHGCARKQFPDIFEKGASSEGATS